MFNNLTNLSLKMSQNDFEIQNEFKENQSNIENISQRTSLKRPNIKEIEDQITKNIKSIFTKEKNPRDKITLNNRRSSENLFNYNTSNIPKIYQTQSNNKKETRAFLRRIDNSQIKKDRNRSLSIKSSSSVFVNNLDSSTISRGYRTGDTIKNLNGINNVDNGNIGRNNYSMRVVNVPRDSYHRSYGVGDSRVRYQRYPVKNNADFRGSFVSKRRVINGGGANSEYEYCG